MPKKQDVHKEFVKACFQLFLAKKSNTQWMLLALFRGINLDKLQLPTVLR